MPNYVVLINFTDQGKRNVKQTTERTDHYVEIFNITRLSDFVNVFPDEESALSGAA